MGVEVGDGTVFFGQIDKGGRERLATKFNAPLVPLIGSWDCEVEVQLFEFVFKDCDFLDGFARFGVDGGNLVFAGRQASWETEATLGIRHGKIRVGENAE